jgi:hypothetical protein
MTQFGIAEVGCDIFEVPKNKIQKHFITGALLLSVSPQSIKRPHCGEN